MIEFKSYHSGSSGNLSSISDGQTTLMLDCGVPWRKVMEAFNFKTSQVAGILAGHGHGDHAKGIRDAAKAGMDIYLSQGTLNEIGLNGHRFHVIKSLVPFGIGTWRVTPFDLVHDSEEPLGFVMQSGREKALYATDTNYIKYRNPLMRDLTLIAISVNYDTEILRQNVEDGEVDIALAKRVLTNHMSFRTARKFFEANDMSQVREIYLLHLSAKNSDARKFKAEIQKLTGIPVYIKQ